MADKMQSLAGVEIRLPNKFSEEYDKTNGFRRYGQDNLYPQQVRDFYRTSPTLHKCVDRMAEHLFGEYAGQGLLSAKIVESLVKDYCLFGGFALHVTYNLVGDIDSVNYVPFEAIRLGEQNAQGLYTQCYYCPDWEGRKTANGKRIDPKRSMTKYFTFADNVEVRLMRMEAAGGPENYGGEILYFSNTLGYPEGIDSILPIVSMEIGIVNATYRDVRLGFQQSMVVSIPRGDDNADQFAENLKQLQGDLNLGKIILYEYSSMEEKPELLNLSSENYDGRFENSKIFSSEKIHGFFKQEVFLRLESGSLGFANAIVHDAYTMYNFSLRPTRNKIEAVLRAIDPSFKLPEMEYPLDQNNSVTTA